MTDKKIGHPKGTRNRHAFRFKVGPKDDPKIITCWAKVIRARASVFLPLRADHVRRSIKLEGVGNTQTCSMAVCATQERNCFPHRVEGYIEWFYKRAYVVSGLDKNGLPSECYIYQHSDGIAQMNDTKFGQKKLLAELETGADRIIHLRPTQVYVPGSRPGIPLGRRYGSRTKVQPRGAKLRFAVAQMGAVAG